MTIFVTGGGGVDYNNSGIRLDYQPNLIEQVAYRDTWGGGLDTYIAWMFETLTYLRELLAESGSIYVHCDWRTSHCIRTIMSEMFGEDNFQNEVVWRYRRWPAKQRRYQKMHDVLLVFTKANGEFSTFNQLFEALAESTLETWGTKQQVADFTEGRRKPSQTNQESPGAPLSDVWEIGIIAPIAKERVGYPTQKPEALIERIISASSNEGDLVLDCFAGSGTTAAVAERLGRRWIAADLSRFAISTTRKRLLSMPDVSPFHVQNMGKYERQAWLGATAEAEVSATHQRDHCNFILKLYKAQQVSGGYQWLHGTKAGRMVHVGGVDAPVTLDDVQSIVAEMAEAIGSGAGAPTVRAVDILGWDFGLETDTEAREMAEANSVTIRLLKIPREVMDAQAVNAGDIRFFELASLAVDQATNRRKREVALTLKDFVMPLDGVPEAVREKVSHWSQWIDYWAVDWDYQNDTFNNQWQSYRTRQTPALSLATRHAYGKAGNYNVVVKVIDVFGNDTTRRLRVQV